MKTIGLIGGMSWESTVTYYQIINAVVKEQLGTFILPSVYYIVLIFMKSKLPVKGMGQSLLSWPCGPAVGRAEPIFSNLHQYHA